MKALLEKLMVPFEDKDYRSSYAASFMNSYVAAQIKTLREQRDLTQQGLADLIGTKQAGISRLENVNYSSWKVETLAKLADAFDVRLKISFEEFGSLPGDVENFNRASLQRAEYKDDLVFHPPVFLLEVLPEVLMKTFSLDWNRSVFGAFNTANSLEAERPFPALSEAVRPQIPSIPAYMIPANTLSDSQEIRI